MTRAEHLQWAKDRALAYLPADPGSAVSSMISDLGKHPETRQVIEGPGAFLAMAGMMAAANGNTNEVRSWVTGFN